MNAYRFGAILALLAVTSPAGSASSRQALPDWSGIWKVQGSMALISTETGRTFVPGERNRPAAATGG